MKKLLTILALGVLGLAFIAVSADGQQPVAANGTGQVLGKTDHVAATPETKPTLESLQKQVADLTAQVAQRDAAISQLRAAAESWLKQFNGCMGDLIMAKSTEKK